MTNSRAAELIDSSLVWENHCCMPFAQVGEWMPQLERYQGAGFDVVHINIGDSDVPLERMVRTLAAYRAWLSERPDRYALPHKARDVEQARREGKLAVCFDIEGAHAIGNDLALIQLFYELGVRWILMAYNCGNAVGGGCHDAVDEGLTALGRELIREMDRVGMVKDIAHTGYRTARDVIEASSGPVNISHSNPRVLNDHPRCVPDDLMKACAASGGVMGISGLGLFLGRNDTSTENFIHSIDYSVDVMGIDHVGIGLDYVFNKTELTGGFEAKRHIWPKGFGYENSMRFVPPERLEDIVAALLARGYRDEDVKRVLGGNFLRVAKQVWK
jgi:membrane dipeptidase